MIGSLSVVIEDEDFHAGGLNNPSTNNSPSKATKTKSPIRLSPNKVNRRTSVLCKYLIFQDLFAETLGALDHSSIRDEDDFDSILNLFNTLGYAESLGYRD
jgi:hypothetical protein